MENHPVGAGRTTSVSEPKPESPDGTVLAHASSLFPWIVCGLGGLFVSFGYFVRIAPSVMAPDLMRDFGVSAAILGNLAAIYFYAYAFLQVPAGIMLDRFGPRRVLTAAIALCALSTVLFAVAGSTAWAYAGRLLIGAASAFSLVGALKLASIWFPPRRFALAAGLSSALGTMGGIMGQAPLAALVQAVGWREALIGTAIAGGVLAVIFWLVVRDGVEVVPQRAAGAAGIFQSLTKVAAIPQVWLVAWASALQAPALLAFAGLWGVPYMMRSYGLGRPAAAAAISLVLVGFAVATPLIGWWSDHIGRRKMPMLVGASASLAAMVALIYGPRLPLVAAYVLCLVIGFGISAMFLALSVGREHGPPGATGTVVGIINMANMFIGAVFQPLIGWLLDLNWDGIAEAGVRVYSVGAYHKAFVVLIASHVLALLTMAMVRETHCRPATEP